MGFSIKLFDFMLFPGHGVLLVFLGCFQWEIFVWRVFIGDDLRLISIIIGVLFSFYCLLGWHFDSVYRLDLVFKGAWIWWLCVAIVCLENLGSCWMQFLNAVAVLILLLPGWLLVAYWHIRRGRLVGRSIDSCEAPTRVVMWFCLAHSKSI